MSVEGLEGCCSFVEVCGQCVEAATWSPFLLMYLTITSQEAMTETLRCGDKRHTNKVHTWEA